MRSAPLAAEALAPVDIDMRPPSDAPELPE
jgi:hypothetical protein